MTEDNQIAKAMEYVGGSLESKKTLKYMTKDGQPFFVTIQVSTPNNISEEVWGMIQDRFAELQQFAVETFN